MLWIDTMLGNVRNAMHGTCHAIRAKHLPRYLAEFSYRFNRRFDLAGMVGRLGRAATVTPPMPYRLVKLPLAGYGLGQARTGVFLFESLAQLLFAYPSRRLEQLPARNRVLRFVILATVALQFATILVPELCSILGLEAMPVQATPVILAMVALTWVSAVLLTRWAARGLAESGLAVR